MSMPYGPGSAPAALVDRVQSRPITLPNRSELAEARSFIDGLRPLALRSLAAMYSPADRLFAFRARNAAAGLTREGLSPRYTAISLIGLAGEPPEAVREVLGPHTIEDVCVGLTRQVPSMASLGDVALTLWAASAVGVARSEPGERRLAVLDPVAGTHATVDVAWALAAACTAGAGRSEALRGPLAERLIAALHPESHLFPHTLGGSSGGRSHVSCYADLVYPIYALSTYARVSGDRRALDAASRSAERLCDLQGADGQWWWHYDYRSGLVVERYPVYAIHQDAMGPMALFALRRAGGPDCGSAVARGVRWLASAKELDGRSLVDESSGVIWRKVARREPGKLSRYLNAGASRLYAPLRCPGLDALFPARSIDFEDRPYHLGWMLYAWGPGLSSDSPEARS